VKIAIKCTGIVQKENRIFGDCEGSQSRQTVKYGHVVPWVAELTITALTKASKNLAASQPRWEEYIWIILDIIESRRCSVCVYFEVSE
jgi:hypothetical protein